MPAVKKLQKRVKGANKGAGKKKRKHIKKIKAKIHQAKEIEMKDCWFMYSFEDVAKFLL